MRTPRGAPVPRVIRSRRDDRYQAGHPAPAKGASAGYVVSVQDDQDTVTVDILDLQVAGVIPLGEMPPVGAIVEVEDRGDLLVIPFWYPGPVGGSVELATTTVYQEFDPDLGLLWSDGSDATSTAQYGEGGPGGVDPWGNYAGALLEAYTVDADIISATIHLRASATRTDGLPDPVRAQFDVYQPIAATYVYSTADFDIPADGTIRDIDVEMAGVDVAELRTLLEGIPQLDLYFDSTGSSVDPLNRVLTVYEVSVTVFHDDEDVAP